MPTRGAFHRTSGVPTKRIAAVRARSGSPNHRFARRAVAPTARTASSAPGSRAPSGVCLPTARSMPAIIQKRSGGFSASTKPFSRVTSQSPSVAISWAQRPNRGSSGGQRSRGMRARSTGSASRQSQTSRDAVRGEGGAIGSPIDRLPAGRNDPRTPGSESEAARYPVRGPSRRAPEAGGPGSAGTAGRARPAAGQNAPPGRREPGRARGVQECAAPGDVLHAVAGGVDAPIRCSCRSQVCRSCSPAPDRASRRASRPTAAPASVTAVAGRRGRAARRATSAGRRSTRDRSSSPATSLRTEARGANALEVRLAAGGPLVVGPGAIARVPRRRAGCASCAATSR